jgi:pimeloyl-ACP methyl ester carboxylesterase
MHTLREREHHGSTARLLLLAAAGMAAAAAFVRYRSRAAERSNPPMGRFVEVEGVRLHYLERGSGQPLVLLHGNGSMIQEFELSGLPDLAARNYRVIEFDRPGYGYSDRPRTRRWTPRAQARLLHRALREMGIERPVVVGHSWGSLVALWLALEYPDYVRSLVVMSGYYFPGVRFDVPILSMPAIPILGGLMRHTISPLVGRLIWPLMLRRIFGPPPTPLQFKTRYPVWMGLRPGQLRASAAESALMIPSAAGVRAHYKELRVPITIIAGADDRLVRTASHSQRLHELLPQSTLHVVPRAGHMVHHAAPHRVMAAIEQGAAAG